MLNKKKILGVDVTDASEKEILEYLIENIEKKEKKLFITTPNPEILVFANKTPEFKNILNNSDLALCDGIGLMIAAKIMGKSLKERTTGADFVKSVCKEVSKSNLAGAKKPITVGFLGGEHGVAVKTAECLVSKYPGLKINFVAEEWIQDNLVLDSKRKTTQNNTQNNAEINKNQRLDQQKSAIDILFVAFGFPKQEKWIYENLDKLPVKAAIGVGGAFDYISGKVPRAPLIVQKIGFEWLFRLIVEPWRIKRQLALISFIFLVLKEKFSLKSAML